MACVAAAAEVPSLESARETERLWMGMEEGTIRPSTYSQVRADGDGDVVIHAVDGRMLHKDEQWATLDPEQLTIERRSLEVDREKQRQQLEKSREDLRESRVRLALELHETEGKRASLVEVSADPNLSAALKQRAGEAVKKLDERLVVIREKLDPAIEDRDVRLLEEENALQISRKQKQFDVLERRSCLRAEAAGQLRFSDALKEKLAAGEPGKPVWMKTGDLLATIVDDRHYEITVTAAGPLLSEIPREQLLVFIQDSQTGKLIPGEYSRTEEVDSGREIVRNFIFVIAESGVENARQAQGTRNLVHVYRKFARPYRIVFKKDIAFAAPDVLEASGWDGLVRHLWPGSKVIQVGPQTIAVEPKNAN